MPEPPTFYVYLLGNSDGTLFYVGVTKDLMNRVEQHKSGHDPDGFTANHGVSIPLYFEKHKYVKNAIAREKQLKVVSRDKKMALIESMNPDWKDLSGGWFTHFD